MLYIVVAVVLVWCVWLMYTRRQATPAIAASSQELTLSEKAQVWVICFLNPVWGGAIFYYGWRTPLPTMAKQANRISIAAFFIEVVLYIGFVVLTTAHQL